MSTAMHDARVSNPPQAAVAADANPSVDACEATPEIVVLGIGNTLLMDDGAGVRVVNGLRADSELPASVALVDGGTLSFSLLAEITASDSLVVVDAVNMQAVPGTVRCFVGDDMDRFLARGGSCSVHEVGLTELLGMARLQDRLPARRALVAVQPERIEWGADPSAAVAAALPEAAARVRECVGEWLR